MPTDHLLDLHVPEALSALKSADVITFQRQLSAPADLQQVTRGEVDEQQAGLRVEQQVAEGVEVQVAGKIRDAQAVALHPHKPGLAAPVGNVHRQPAILQGDIAGDKEGVSTGNHLLRRLIQMVQLLGHHGW